ncbi:MAG: antibiotic biosynthesis monooxygenase [Defluviitaleaceae bacterium]|nr:antibiotic biosynthesis monooxygenase [Defluviitaleaceae bacterium]
MIVLLVQFEVAAEKRDEFLAFFDKLAIPSQAEEGCIEYNLYSDMDKPTSFSLIEKWRDQAAIDFHNATPHFTAHVGTLRDYAGDTITAKKYIPTK